MRAHHVVRPRFAVQSWDPTAQRSNGIYEMHHVGLSFFINSLLTLFNMKFSLALAGLATAAVVSASPVRTNPFKRMNNGTAPTDTQVLQYALTLENLEANF